jgi:hypothetical protein
MTLFITLLSLLYCYSFNAIEFTIHTYFSKIPKILLSSQHRIFINLGFWSDYTFNFADFHSSLFIVILYEATQC